MPLMFESQREETVSYRAKQKHARIPHHYSTQSNLVQNMSTLRKHPSMARTIKQHAGMRRVARMRMQ
eukprot:6191542-Pleurochrysis_carterae.AAC.1